MSDTTISYNAQDVQRNFTLWVAYCSNKDRSIEDCVKKTEELIEIVKASTLGENWSNLFESKIVTIFLNRDNDYRLLESLFAINNKDIALACIQNLINSPKNATLINSDLNLYFDNYKTRFGEDLNMFMLKLNWLTLAGNYKNPINMNEVERILAKINTMQSDTVGGGY